MLVSYFALQSSLLVARELGFFEEAGVDAVFVPTASSTEQMAALIAGEVDVVQTAADNLLALAAVSPDVAAIFHVADFGLDQALVARAEVSSVEGLRNRRLGVDSPDSGYAIVGYRLLADAGLARTDYEVVTLGGPQARLEALAQDDADAVLLNPVLTRLAVAAGAHVLVEAAASFPRYPNLTFAARRDTIQGRAAELSAFRAAVGRGIVWATDPANDDALTELVAAGRELSLDRARASVADERRLRTTAMPSDDAIRSSLRDLAALRREVTGSSADADAALLLIR